MGSPCKVAKTPSAWSRKAFQPALGFWSCSSMKSYCLGWATKPRMGVIWSTSVTLQLVPPPLSRLQRGGELPRAQSATAFGCSPCPQHLALRIFNSPPWIFKRLLKCWFLLASSCSLTCLGDCHLAQVWGPTSACRDLGKLNYSALPSISWSLSICPTFLWRDGTEGGHTWCISFPSIIEQFILAPNLHPLLNKIRVAQRRSFLPRTEFWEHLGLNYPEVQLFPPHSHHKQLIKKFLSTP